MAPTNIISYAHKSDGGSMVDITSNNNTVGNFTVTGVGVLALIVSVTVAVIATKHNHLSVPSTHAISEAVKSFFNDPKTSMEDVVKAIEGMGTLGYVYFGIAYTIAEIFAVPAIPLTASAGYLFGVLKGTMVVLVSAVLAASCSFFIGRTFLRSHVEKALENYPEFKKIDKAIGKQGFKLMLLLRLSPIFPFALSNYLYGVTSVDFWPYLWGTLFGFMPGTIAYVYTGQVGKTLSLDSASSRPWYVYAAALIVLSGFLKIVADISTGVIRDIEEQDKESSGA